MNKLVLLLSALVFSSLAQSADVLMRWDSVQGATGYKIQNSTDLGASWDGGVDVGDVTTYTYLAVPDTGIQMFRAVAYNAQGESVRWDAGAWHCGDCGPPPPAGALGVR